MRQIFTSPRPENVDRVVALMAEHGIATAVQNRLRYDRSTWKRHSYLQRHERRDDWDQVWIRHPDDYTRARELMLGIGIEPLVTHGEELAASRSTSPVTRREHVASRARRIALLVVLAACGMLMLRYMGWL